MGEGRAHGGAGRYGGGRRVSLERAWAKRDGGTPCAPPN